ncbi:MAG: FeoC-like transcriptional regulator [Thiohalocapsa sp.]|jgi:DNA-binding IclR family transcriptional regulator
MILARLRDYLAEHRRVSLVDMANRFDTDPDALRGMLATLERKGRVRKLPAGSLCGTCARCDQAAPELYEWVDDAPSASSPEPASPATST